MILQKMILISGVATAMGFLIKMMVQDSGWIIDILNPKELENENWNEAMMEFDKMHQKQEV